VASGGLVAHLPLQSQGGQAALYVAAAAVIFCTEFLTGPALLSPITGEGPYRVIVVTLKEGGLIEASQLLIGLLGVYAADRQVWSLALLALPTGLVYHSFKRVKELDDVTRQMLESVVDLAIWAARVHDIGKIAIPDRILNKPGGFTDQERHIMESDSEKGAEFLGRDPQFARGVEIVRHHHEGWGGRGYPHKLKGNEIPFGSRVIAVADSFDAMTSDRPYRQGMSAERASAILREGRRTQWESSVVDALIRSIAVDAQRATAPAHPASQSERSL